MDWLPRGFGFWAIDRPVEEWNDGVVSESLVRFKHTSTDVKPGAIRMSWCLTHGLLVTATCSLGCVPVLQRATRAVPPIWETGTPLGSSARPFPKGYIYRARADGILTNLSAWYDSKVCVIRQPSVLTPASGRFIGLE